MALTTFATNDNLTKKYWEEKLLRDALRASYFPKMFGSTSSDVVHVNTALEKGQGDRIRFGLRRRLTGAGVTGSEVLEGKEESLTRADFDLTLEEYAHAVRVRKGIDAKRAMFSVTDEAENAIKDWMSEKVDEICFDALGVGPNIASTATTGPAKVFYRVAAGVASAASFNAARLLLSNTLSESVLTLDMISTIKAYAKTGGNRSQIPLRPIKIDGKEYFIMLVHPDAALDLKTSSAWQQAQRDAQVRGDSNPLFSGALGVWDSVIIHEHENCQAFANGGASSNQNWTKGAFLGAQALCFAFGQRPEVVQESFDYQREVGYAVTAIMRAGLTTFDSTTYGALGVALRRTNASGL
jgi:N4-gp56 family major capsid protein